MDATRKAIFRSRLRQAAERKEKIDSPLVRYNDLGQPVCKVCDVSIKSEALWGAHLGSRQHKEAAEDLKEQARRAKAAAAPSTNEENENENLNSSPPQTSHPVKSNGEKAASPAKDESTGPLPQGFFDNATADMKARGVEPPKINMQEELDQFNKLIEEDVKAVDERYREEEIEAVEIRHEEEEIEQSLCTKRVEILKKRKLEFKQSKQKDSKKPKPTDNLLDELSSEDDSDEDTILDWRARR